VDGLSDKGGKPMTITKRLSPNRNKGRQGQIPDFIVCHQTGGSFTSAINTILNPKNQVSYHFVVAQDGTIIQAVNIQDTAWANGTTNNNDNRDNMHSTIPEIRARRRNANQFTVSIGFADTTIGELSPPQLSSAIDLIRHIRKEVQSLFGLEIPLSNIIGHHQVTPITRPNCPGSRFPFAEIITQLQEKELPQVISSQPASSQGVSTPSSWAREAWEWAIAQDLTDGTNPQGAPTREQMVTLLHRYHKSIA